MSEVLERVARALEPKCRAFGSGDMPMQVAREFARAAIEEMRAPTADMIERADLDLRHFRGDFAHVWSEMIDEALRPHPVGGRGMRVECEEAMSDQERAAFQAGFRLARTMAAKIAEPPHIARIGNIGLWRQRRAQIADDILALEPPTQATDEGAER